MSSSYDIYFRRNTWVYSLDPRVKLAVVFALIILTFLWPYVSAALGVSVVALALLFVAQAPRARVVRFLRGLVFLLVMVLGLTTLFAGGAGPAWVVWGPVRITPQGFHQGALLASRLLALGLTFFFWLSTTDQGEMVRGFVALGLPYDWGLTVALALRYLPILAGLFEQVREAQEARGLDLTQRSFFARLQAYRPILIAVVIGALRHGERLGWALEARALGNDGVRRTTYRPLRFHQGDYLAFAMLSVILIGAILLRLL